MRWFLTATGAGSIYLDGNTPPVEWGAAILEEPDDFVADVLAARQLAEERWAYLALRQELDGLDLEVLEAEALALLGDVPDPTTFRLALLRFVAGLHDGHAGVLPTPEFFVRTTRWPFHPVEVREGIVVDGVLDGIEDVERGDLLLEVDGRPVEAWLEDAERFACASTPGARRRAALRYVSRRTRGDLHRFRFRDADGNEYERTLPCPPSYRAIPDPGALETTRVARVLEGNVGYFRPGDFSAPADSGFADAGSEERKRLLAATFDAFDEDLGSFSECSGLILDLRANPGGTDLLGQFLTDRLLEQENYTYYRLASRGPGGWRRSTRHGSGAPAASSELRQPLVVLIDEDTFSTADNVAACLADHHPDVTFVGRPNGAGSGAPRAFELPRTGVSLSFCTQRVSRGNGEPIEGHPIQPDVLVSWTRADLLAGRDPDLEAALAHLAAR